MALPATNSSAEECSTCKPARARTFEQHRIAPATRYSHEAIPRQRSARNGLADEERSAVRAPDLHATTESTGEAKLKYRSPDERLVVSPTTRRNGLQSVG